MLAGLVNWGVGEFYLVATQLPLSALNVRTSLRVTRDASKRRAHGTSERTFIVEQAASLILHTT